MIISAALLLGQRDGLPVRSLPGCLLISLYQGGSKSGCPKISGVFFLERVSQASPTKHKGHTEHSISFLHGDVQTQNDVILAEAFCLFTRLLEILLE